MVRVFTTQQCSQCKTVKRFLEHKQIPYETVDITNDYERAVELQLKTGYVGVPVVEINETVFIKGYNPSAMMSALR